MITLNLFLFYYCALHILFSDEETKIYFTGSNPQNVRFHLLNSDNDDAVLISLFYTRRQRLDVYRDGMYMLPENADYEGDNIKYSVRLDAYCDGMYIPQNADYEGDNIKYSVTEE